MDTWVIFTIFAAIMQSVRTAGQKRLATHISPMSATMVRYVFGMPFAVAYFYTVVERPPEILRACTSSPDFMKYAALAGVAQILSTYWLIKVLSFRNFVVGTVLSKTEAIQAAIIGTVFFSAELSWTAWLAIIVGGLGIVLLSATQSLRSANWASVSFGLLSGFGFALTALWLREASTSLPYTFIQSAAATLLFTVILQAALCLLYTLWKERDQIPMLRNKLPIALFIGATSALGSVGWYTAMTYQNAALVRSLGQVELLFAIGISHWFFGERITRNELLGVAAIFLSVIILLLYL